MPCRRAPGSRPRIADAAVLSETEVFATFPFGEAGWLAVERWSFAFVSLLQRHRERAGASHAEVDRLAGGHNLDLVSATGFGYGLRRAVEALR